MPEPISTGLILGALGISAGSTAFQNWMNSREAKKNRKFQKGMSDTAHQREVRDLYGAGLNPILSASKGGGGASTPSGSTAKHESMAKGLPETLIKQKLAEQQARVTTGQTAQMDANTAVLRNTPFVQRATIRREDALTNLTNAKTVNEMAQHNKTGLTDKIFKAVKTGYDNVALPVKQLYEGMENATDKTNVKLHNIERKLKWKSDNKKPKLLIKNKYLKEKPRNFKKLQYKPY